MPNNREWALLLWVVVIGVWALARRDVRSSFQQVLRAGAHPKILVASAFMAVWVSLEVWLGAVGKLWVASLATATTIWFVTSGLVLFFRFNDASKDPHFFRRKAAATLWPAALLVSFVDAFVLPFPAELLLQPLLACLAMAAAVAGREERYRRIGKVANGVIALTGLALLAHTVVGVVTDWDTLDNGELLLQVALPVWLTIGLLPFVYAVALWAFYERAFLLMGWKSGLGWSARLQSKLALLMGFHVNVHELAAFSGPWLHRLGTATSFREARGVVQDFRDMQHEAARAETEERERLARFAGVAGVDENGQRFDRREFGATTEALRWLATCMMGWYRQRNQYRSDLVQAFGDDFTAHGLGQPSGITVHVSEDGQAWYAWRRTVTGWCFAIGATGPPPSEWEYDGPEPPRGFPGQDPSWGSGPFSDGANRNW